jgi:hypothetical protein
MRKTIFALASGLLIAGCGGGGGGSGGGGGGGGGTPQVPFVSWNLVQPNTTTVVPGSSQEVTYTANASTDTVTSLSSVTPNEAGARYFVTTNANNQATAIAIQSARGTNVSFTTANGSSLGSAVRYFQTPQRFFRYTGAVTGDGTSAALAADESYSGWNYQSYGVWITGRGTGSGTAGVASVGAATLGSNIPTIGTGTFTGSSAGLYVNPQGNYFVTTAFMQANVSFTNRTVNFSTVNTAAATAASAISGNFGTLVPGLDMTGTLSYAAGSNRLTGVVSTASSSTGNPMSGAITANFYGPNANEIGGTFSTTGTGIETYTGAFGGRR